MNDGSCKHGLRRGGCALCQPAPKRSERVITFREDMLVGSYSVKFDKYAGNPVAEVFYDRGQVTAFDEHFRFGLRKARLIVSSRALLQRFVAQHRLSEADLRDFRGSLTDPDVEVDYSDWFVRGSGDVVDLPYVKLTSRSRPSVHIGLGVEKARAVLAVMPEVERWLRRN